MAHQKIHRSLFVTFCLLCCLAIAGGAWASSLTVNSGAAKAGTYGLEVTVGTTCTAAADYVVPDGLIAGPATEEGCLTLTAANVDITAGSVTFKAGDSMAFQNGFSVASGASFTATLDQGMTGRAYVQDNSPAGETLYRARLYVDLSSFSPGSGDGFEHFTAYSGAGTWQFDLRLEDSGADVALVVAARDGGGTATITADSAVPTTYFAIELEWKASDAGLSNGYLDVWIDGTPATGLSSLDNETRRIDLVRWGVVDNVTNATSGTMNLDEFVSQRSSTTIGILP
ncbi:MAG: hypothetical protein ACC742_13730 [Thermoanaerobaculales bacterium]